MIKGLDDYTTDARGDVGSWVRIACVRGLAGSAALLLAHAPRLGAPFAAYLPAPRFHAAVAGILKQGVERLDNVRQAAGEQLRALQLEQPAQIYFSWRSPSDYQNHLRRRSACAIPS